MGRQRIIINKDEVYGRLKATGISKKKGKNYKWECICECGNIAYVLSTDLKSGHTKSCGKCLDKAYNTGLNYLYNAYRRGAIQRGLSFLLTKQEFNDIITLNCHYCGRKPSQVLFKKGMQQEFIYNGIDRFDNTIGYEVNNVVPCCGFCNFAKGKHTYEEFKNWIKDLIQFNT